jgi:hypothetical protein
VLQRLSVRCAHTTCRTGEGDAVVAADESSIIIICDEEAQVSRLDALMRAGGAEVQTSPRRQLDGAAVASWVTVVTAAITTAPALMTSLQEFLTRNHPKSIQLGDLLIENPGPDAVAAIVAYATLQKDG